MPTMTDDLALVKDILDRVLASGDLEPLLESLADDVVLAVATPNGPERHEGTGRTAVVDYFEALRELFAFWRVTYASRNRRVLVLIDERFTLEPSGLVAQSEFAVLFDLRDGLVTRTVYATVPPRVEYELTKLGRSLYEPIAGLAEWARKNRATIEAARTSFDAGGTAKPSHRRGPKRIPVLMDPRSFKRRPPSSR